MLRVHQILTEQERDTVQRKREFTSEFMVVSSAAGNYNPGQIISEGDVLESPEKVELVGSAEMIEVETRWAIEQASQETAAGVLADSMIGVWPI